MAASPSSVITLGLGSWGSPSLIITLGYGSGAAVTDACQMWPRGMWPSGMWPDTCLVPGTGGGGTGAGTWQRFPKEPTRRRNLADDGVPRRLHRPEDEPVSRETRSDVADAAEARQKAQELSRQIVEATGEIARIKSQMRLSSNQDAIRALEREIAAVENNILKAKQEAEDMLLLAILL